MKRLFLLGLILLLAFQCFAQEKEQPRIEEPRKELERVKTWKMPDNLLKTLKDMVEEFNKRFQDTLDIYKYGLKAKMAEFKDMPDDVVFDINTGVFMLRGDYIRLQREANERLLSEANKDKEVKKDEKKTN